MNLSLSDTFSPVSHISSLQLLLALAALKDLRVFTWDVDSAYLHGKIDQRDLVIVYKRRLEPSEATHDHMTPSGFCDANYAEDPRDCKSTSRYASMLTGGPIAWKSKKQASMALSTTEA